MRKFSVLVLGFVFAAVSVKAQSKVFKEVSDEISSQIKVIKQDDALVGYLVFTQLEKANEDSFNYKITIMDENLNDIGKVNFRQEKLYLQSVSFDQDVLCLGYLKSNVIGNEFSTNRKLKKAVENAKNAVVFQFLNLEGKIIKTNTIPAEVKIKGSDYIYSSMSRLTVGGGLKQSIQLKNVPQKGFACFYGDENGNNLIMYNTAGEQMWKKKLNDASAYGMMTSGSSIYMLAKLKEEKTPEGGYELQGYSAADDVKYDKITLKDKQGNFLKVLNFANDPATGKAYLAGNIINPEMSQKFYKARHIAKGAYSGVFTINLDGPKKSDIKEMYSYWGDGSMNPTITNKGYYTDQDFYSKYYETIRDFDGNTYFVGSSFVKRPRIGAIISSVLLSPLIFYSPFQLGVGGTSKCRVTDAMLVKQSPNGKLSFDNTIPCNKSDFFVSKLPLSMYDNRTFYTVNNTDTKTNYLIVDDVKDIVIYNVNKKKVARTVPHRDGKILTNIYPAKEGHIMVSEVNRKEKSTKLSIESL